MKNNLSRILTSLKLFCVLAIAAFSTLQVKAQWNAMGPNQGEWIMCLDFDHLNNMLLVGTAEGFWYYNLSTSTWTQREDVGWIGRTVHAITAHPTLPGRIITGRENAFFKGYMEYTNDWGVTNNNAYNANGGWVTDVKNVPGSPDVFFATTWSDVITGELLKSTNGGMSWALQSNYIHQVLTEIVINPLNTNIMYISGDALVTKTTNGGTNWTVAANGLPAGLGVYCIALSPGNPDILLAANDNGIYRTTDGGANWVQVNNNASRRLEFNHVNPNLAAAVTFSPFKVLFSTDAGATWMDFTGNYAGAHMRDVAFSGDGNTMYVASRDQGVFWMDITQYVPVELVSFTAEPVINGIRLNWSTTSELNNSHFEIERSADKITFEKIASVNGYGTTTVQQTYSYIDKNVKEGIYYYRLKQVDFDGTSSYSLIIEVENAVPSSFVLAQNYPNPFNPSTSISWQTPVSGWQSLKVYNAIGKEVAALVNEFREAGKHSVEFDASSARLSSGVYFYKLQIGNFVQTKKMILLQ